MSISEFDKAVQSHINEKAKELEDLFESDLISYLGIISPTYVRSFRNFIESVKIASERKSSRLSIILRVPGGSVETAERYVDIVRQHYDEVYFIVPDAAMSAGTIWCMSGDKIFMDYASSLGPIDPQVMAEDGSHLVPALGYLDKVEEITKKPRLSNADYIFLQKIDLGKLGQFEQAKELSIDLLKVWLVQYKFKTWAKHETTNAGTPVTDDEKKKRAQEIATLLSNNTHWHSHNRNIDIKKLKRMKLKIEDYSKDDTMRSAIRAYNDLLTSYVDQKGMQFLLHHHTTII